jgi:CBS domain-containing protein
MLVAETYTPDVVCCRPQATALEAARLMREKHVGDVVVVTDPDGERVPIGVVTDRDLAIEVLGQGRDAAAIKLASLIRTQVVIARDSEDTHTVIERMHAHGVRRIPVVDARGMLLGIVTLDDLLRMLLSDMQLLLQTEARAQRHEQTARR